MRDWVGRSKEISRRYRASRWAAAATPRTDSEPPKEAPLPLPRAVAPWRTQNCWICTLAFPGNLLPEVPGKAILGAFAGSTLLWSCLRGYLGEASGCCGSPWGAACCCLRGWACASSRNPFVVSLQRPLLTEFNVVPAGKGKIFKGPRSTFTDQATKGKFGAETIYW